MSNVYTGLFLHNLLRAVIYSREIVLEVQSMLSILSFILNSVHCIVMHFYAVNPNI